MAKQKNIRLFILRYIAAIVSVCLVCILKLAAQENKIQVWNFDADTVGEPPAGFSFNRTGEGQLGHWVVQTEKDAPSASNVLTQMDTDPTDYRFPIAIANTIAPRDVRVSVSCKPISGEVDQAAGLIFRYQDENNYYFARANALEDNVRLYKVVNGSRQQIAGWNGRIQGGIWHKLRIEAQGQHFMVYWDEQKVMDARDQTFTGAGKVGLWTKADSVTTFDDLTVEPLAS